MDKKNISNAVIRRLPRYYRYLNMIIYEGTERISSAALSKRMDVTASQIRQDLNHFGGFGQQGYGYNVKYLRDEIAKVLGLDHNHEMALIGVGNFGNALINSTAFSKYGFHFKCFFDCNRSKIGSEINGITIHDIDDIVDILKENPVDIAVLTVPKQAAQALADKLVKAGVTAIWNFAHCELSLPPGVVVENVYLVESLLQLSYRKLHLDN